jgi:hypothetical protein
MERLLMKRNKNQESDPWMNLDEGKLQHEGARDKKFSEKGQGEPEQN